MSPEVVLEIAATQWDGVPSAQQIIRALEAGGFKIVAKDAADAEEEVICLPSDMTPDGVRGWLSSACSLLDVTSTSLAKAARLTPSTVNKFLRAAGSGSNLNGKTINRLYLAANEIAKSKDRTLLCLEGSSSVYPLRIIREIMNRRDLSAHALAENAGISPSTLTRALNNPNHKFIITTRTLNKIVEWDRNNA